MLAKEKIARINALAKKAKKEGLNEAEAAEQAALRKDYLASLRGDLEKQLVGVKVIDPKGHDVTPKKLRIRKKSVESEQKAGQNKRKKRNQTD